MKTVNIITDAATTSVPVLIPFQGGPHDDFAYGEEVLIQLVDNDGNKVGEPEVRSVVKTHVGDENTSSWYDAFIPKK